MVYTSGSRALSLLEAYVHLPSGILPYNYVMMSIDIPDTLSRNTVGIDTLSADWIRDRGISETRAIGDDFIASHSACVLQVPSAIVPGDYNYLINPDHPDLDKIRILSVDDFPFDERMFRL